MKSVPMPESATEWLALPHHNPRTEQEEQLLGGMLAWPGTIPTVLRIADVKSLKDYWCDRRSSVITGTKREAVFYALVFLRFKKIEVTPQSVADRLAATDWPGQLKWLLAMQAAASTLTRRDVVALARQLAG